MKNQLLFILMIAVVAAGSLSGGALPTGVNFRKETLVRKGNFGDNWCQTWGADGNLYTMLDDGTGWWGSPIKSEAIKAFEGSMLLRIQGGPDFSAQDVEKMPGWPENPGKSPLYAYGTVSVGGTLYVWLWKSESETWYRRPIANRLLYSEDSGKTFYRWNGVKETAETFDTYEPESFFFYKEDPRWKIDRDAYAFNWIAFCQNGQDNTAAKDDFVYMYSPEQHEPRHLAVIRVHKSHILDREHYEYFKGWNDGSAEWTKNMSDRGINLLYPAAPEGEEWMWASWFPSVVYNPGLDLYLMVSYGITDPGKTFWDGWCQNCQFPGSLGFWYSKTPYGPWTQFHYTERFYADSEDNRTYGFKLNPKWISEDGTKLYLIWSDAGRDHSDFYKWNQMEIELTTRPAD